MKFLKNKFIFSILFFILLILGIETYSFYSIRDTNSYVSLINGIGFLDDKNLEIKKREVIQIGSTIKTIGEDSLAVIEWGDNSITRLGGNTEIIINENYITSDLKKIQISVNLIRGKTWNNLVSLFGTDSYFKQYVDDTEAGVRGTIFEVNKDKDYVYVENHEITLKNLKTTREVLLTEEKPMSLKTFTLIDLQEFILKFKDKTWEEINKKLDNEMLLKLQEGLKKELQKNNPLDIITGIFSKKQKIINKVNSGTDLDKVKKDIEKLNVEDKKVIYDETFSKYQKLNFLSANNEEYDKKLYYKEILLQTSYDEKNSESLIKNSLYDINDMISSNNISKLKESVSVLVNNKDTVKNLNIDFNSYVDLSSAPVSLKDSLIQGLKPLEKILNINLNIDAILKLEEDTRSKFNEFLENNVGGLIDSIKNK